MYSEKNVICFDFTSHSNIWIHHTLKIIDRITVESRWIEHRKFNRETSYILSPVVLDGLRIETKRPCEEGDPPKNFRNCIPFVVFIVVRVSKRLLCIGGL